MNKVILCGRLTKKPEVRVSQSNTTIARYTIAVDRRGKDQGTDFIQCVVFDKGADFADKYLDKGTKVIVTGRIQTGSYTDKDGKKVYTTDIIVEDQEFAESKRFAEENGTARMSDEEKEERRREKSGYGKPSTDDFMVIPDNLDDDELPFN